MTRPNVVYVTVDSIRADHVGHLGYDRPTTPNIDRLAARGTVCPRAMASGIPTFYSFKSLLGGLYALDHSREVGMPDATTTLAERFRERGYRTAGFSAGNPWLTRAYGYDRGFETFRDFLTDERDGVDESGLGRQFTALTRRLQPYVESNDFLRDKLGFVARATFALLDHTPLETAETVTDAAVDWLRSRTDARPFFLWVHYMDPHYPWVPRDVDVERFCDGGITKREVGRLWHAVSAHGGADGGRELSPAELDRVVDLYDCEVRRTDDGIGRLLDALDAAGELDDTVVSVVGDHGTELLDHGGFSHGPRTLYDEVIHVPLVFAGPSVPEGRVDGVTSLVDVPVSLLRAAGIDWDPDDFVGTPAFDDRRETATTEVVYDYEPHSGANGGNGLLRACVDWPWKLVVNDELGTHELYHLERDPDERTDRAASEPAVRDRLLATLDATRRRIERRSRTVEERTRVRATITELKARGRI